ncbi:MAG: SH3 domain-containing protein [Cyanobacteria bacterium P01_G01_bin.54]
MPSTPWKFPFFTLLLGILASLGQAATQTAAQAATQATHLPAAMPGSLAQVVNSCGSENNNRRDFPLFYAEVTTDGSDLRIREEPAGEPVGLVPDGWKLVVLEWSRNGVWARVTGAYGFIFPGGFSSAPEFVEGWVAAGYLKDLGRFCDKPTAVGQLMQPELFGINPVAVEADWLALGDALNVNPEP